MANREFNVRNREHQPSIFPLCRKRPFLTHLFGGSRTRSVLALDLQMRSARWWTRTERGRVRAKLSGARTTKRGSVPREPGGGHRRDANPGFCGLAEDLDAAWKAPGVTMRARQQLLRTLVNEITADIDDEAREKHGAAGNTPSAASRSQASSEERADPLQEANQASRNLDRPIWLDLSHFG